MLEQSDATAVLSVRLADKVRALIGAGKLDDARALVEQGDGTTRSLAKEYSLMVRGLSATIGIILDLVVGRHEEPDDGLHDLLRRLTDDCATTAGGIIARDVAAEGIRGQARAAQIALEQAQTTFFQRQTTQSEQIAAALEDSDAERALELLQHREIGEYLPLHDALLGFMARSFAWVYHRSGADGLAEFQRALAQGQRAGIDMWEGMATEEFVQAFSFLLKLHMGEFTVVERADHWLLDQTLCGSGGRLIASGAYEGPGALPRVRGPLPITAGQADLPIYCTHCPAWNTLAPLEWYGREHLQFPEPARADGGCVIKIPKKMPHS